MARSKYFFAASIRSKSAALPLHSIEISSSSAITDFMISGVKNGFTDERETPYPAPVSETF
jgi:hypothetical protein